MSETNNQDQDAVDAVVARHAADMNVASGIVKNQSFQNVVLNPTLRQELLRPENRQEFIDEANQTGRIAGQAVGAATFVLSAVPGAFMVSGFIKKFKSTLPEEKFFKRLGATIKEKPVAAAFLALPFIAAPLASWKAKKVASNAMQESLEEAKSLAMDIETGNVPDTSASQTPPRQWSQDERNQSGYKAEISKSV